VDVAVKQTDKVPTARGRTWHASTIKAVLGSVDLDDLAYEARKVNESAA
jgi:hypothetical protein